MSTLHDYYVGLLMTEILNRSRQSQRVAARVDCRAVYKARLYGIAMDLGCDKSVLIGTYLIWVQQRGQHLPVPWLRK